MIGARTGRLEAPRVVAVLVTHQRRQLLAEALTAVAAQQMRPDAIVVVDNASSDGTAQMVLTDFPEVDLVQLTRNTGGAGGFAAGIQRALDAHRPDLLWLMDDDTIPQPSALGELLQAWTSHIGRPALVASRVVWTDGRDQPRNIPRVPPRVGAAVAEAAAAVGCRPIRTASFVSLLVDADAIRASGTVIADYFIWNDDFEFTAKLLRSRPGLYCPTSVVVHKTAELGTKVLDPGSRFYYEVRNKVWLYLAGKAFAPVESLLWAGGAVRNWMRWYLHSADRAAMRAALRRGLWDGLTTRPRPNALVLAEAGWPPGETT